MDLSGDELAGVVDLFGALTRDELAEALAELAFRQGEEYDPPAFETDINDAVRTYHLVAVVEDALDGSAAADGPGGEALLLAGPLAFPTLPPDARDLPHILDVEPRRVSTEQAGAEVAELFREDARAAIEAGEQARLDTLLDASYELEQWAGVDLGAVREELAEATQTN